MSPYTYGLMPLENVLLGDYVSEKSEDLSSPIDTLFERYDQQMSRQDILKYPLGLDESKIESPRKLLKDRIKLGLYRGIIEEGYNLRNQCTLEKRALRYPIPSEKQQAKRTFIATLQYKILDLTSYFLPVYAKYFEWEKDDYKNLVDNLVGNYCSQNLTTISLRNLKINMMRRYDRADRVNLPSIKENLYFPEKLGLQESRRSARESEFAYTIELFKSSCSWGNDTDNYRLLVPLLRSPVVAAMVLRELSGQSLTWIEEKSRPGLESEDTTRIVCKNLICRKSSEKDFNRFVPKALGSTGVLGDFKNLWCTELRDADYLYKNQVPQIAKIIKSRTMDEDQFLVSQLVALESGVPDLMILAPKFSDLLSLTRSSVDQTWDFWAEGQNDNYKKALAYEEALQIEPAPTRLFFKNLRPKFSVELDINQGEFDRVNNILGKLRTKMNLKFSKKFLKWAREQWSSIERISDEQTAKQREERIRLPFKKMIGEQMETLLSSYPVVPLKKEIDQLIIDEILGQLVSYDGNFFKGEVEGMVEVPVYINYGLFALRHLRDRYKIKRNQGLISSDLEKLRFLRL
ncbi:MAG: hypothetical protein VXV96_05320 [Bdellovibrionota bacterium]|nr:hypothetical protein [Bdellovibrionota bacterium]